MELKYKDADINDIDILIDIYNSDFPNFGADEKLPGVGNVC